MKATSTKTNQNAHTAANLHTNIGTVMNTMIKHLSLSLTALVCATGVTAALADKIDASKVTTFAAGAPARAAEVNSTIAELTSAIDDNDQRIAQLLATPAAPPAITLNVDCGADPAALNSAINNASLQTSLEINVSGACSAVSITRDHVSVDGGADGASITSTAAETPALRVKQARGIILQNLTLSGSDVAEFGLEVTLGSAVETSNLTISGTVNSAVETTINSALMISGDNTITAGQAQGLYAAAASTIYISDGTTTITSDSCTFETELGGVLVSEGTLNATGACVAVRSDSSIAIESGTVTTGTASIVGTLSLDSRGSDGAVTLNHSGRLLVFSGGTMFAIAREGATTTINATEDSAEIWLAGNASASLLLLDGGEGSQVTASSSIFMSNAYLIASAVDAGFDGRIDLGVSENYLRADDSRVVFTGNSDSNNLARLHHGSVSLQLGSNLVLGTGSTVDPSAAFDLYQNTELRSFNLELGSNGNQITCISDGHAFSFIDQVFTDHCPD